MKVLCETEYTIQKRSAVVWHYLTLSICLTLISCWIRYCPTPPSWENILCSGMSTKLSVLSDSAPNLNYQVSSLTMMPKSRGNTHKATGCVHKQIFCGHTEVFPICSQTSGMVYVSCGILPLTPLPFSQDASTSVTEEWTQSLQVGWWKLISKIKIECFRLNRLRSE